MVGNRRCPAGLRLESRRLRLGGRDASTPTVVAAAAQVWQPLFSRKARRRRNIEAAGSVPRRASSGAHRGHFDTKDTKITKGTKKSCRHSAGRELPVE
jgi:hypothetical protein